MGQKASYASGLVEQMHPGGLACTTRLHVFAALAQRRPQGNPVRGPPDVPIFHSFRCKARSRAISRRI